MSVHGAAAADRHEILVFAAASLRDAMHEIAQGYTASVGQKVVVSYAASSALARQIENGAPADIIVSADPDWMDYLAKRNLIRSETRVNLLRNRLVLIAPTAAPVSLQIAPGFPLARVLGDGRLAIADPDHVPAGKYGREALEKLGVWRDVAGRLARAENVRAALVFVARGEAPLGIVYRTDAQAEPKVRVVGEFPPDAHAPIIYPAALTLHSRHPRAPALLRHLQSPAAGGIFRKHGFVLDR